MRSILGQCASCCACPAVEIESEKVVNSATACGIEGPGDNLYRSVELACSGGMRSQNQLLDDLTCEIQIGEPYAAPECCTNFFSGPGGTYRSRTQEYDFEFTETVTVEPRVNLPTDPTIVLIDYAAGTARVLQGNPGWPPLPGPISVITQTGSFARVTQIGPGPDGPCSVLNNFVGTPSLTVREVIYQYSYVYEEGEENPVSSHLNLRAQEDFTWTHTGVDSLTGEPLGTAVRVSSGEYYDSLGNITGPWSSSEDFIFYNQPLAGYVRDRRYTDSSQGPAPGDVNETFGSLVTVSPEYGSIIDVEQQARDRWAATLPAFTGVYSDGSPTEEYIRSEDGRSLYDETARFRWLFQVPASGRYRVDWTTRRLPQSGRPVDSVEVIERGVTRPTVLASGGGGSGCVLVAVMNSSGQVTSVRVLNPGTGYTSPPTITVQTATNGGTTSTGWTATLSAGRVVSVTGGSGGDYLPTITFADTWETGGSTATGTVAVDAQGGVTAITLTSGGGRYAAEPTMTFRPKISTTGVTLYKRPVFHIHIGDELAQTHTWDGAIPSGYNPADDATWPRIPSAGASPNYLTMANPSTSGNHRVKEICHIRAYC